MSDEIRERLSRLDPMHPGVSTEPVTTPSSRQLLESTMSTQVEEREQARPNRSRWLSVAAAVAIVAVGAFALTRGGAVEEPLVLSAGAGDDGLSAMCLAFSVEDLARAELAFEGTVTRAEGETIELSVDNWFKGGDAGTVVLEAPSGMEALIGGIPFVVGDAYLISASQGVVDYCGFSGPATPEFRSAFEAAFGG